MKKVLSNVFSSIPVILMCSLFSYMLVDLLSNGELLEYIAEINLTSFLLTVSIFTLFAIIGFWYAEENEK